MRNLILKYHYGTVFSYSPILVKKKRIRYFMGKISKRDR